MHVNTWHHIDGVSSRAIRKATTHFMAVELLDSREQAHKSASHTCRRMSVRRPSHVGQSVFFVCFSLALTGTRGRARRHCGSRSAGLPAPSRAHGWPRDAGPSCSPCACMEIALYLQFNSRTFINFSREGFATASACGRACALRHAMFGRWSACERHHTLMAAQAGSASNSRAEKSGRQCAHMAERLS